MPEGQVQFIKIEPLTNLQAAVLEHDFPSAEILHICRNTTSPLRGEVCKVLQLNCH